MKYCSKCKVNVNHQLDNCPLCGSYLDEKDNNDNCEIYRDMDEKSESPVLHEMKSQNFFRFKFNRILLVLVAFCVVLNILVTPQSHWSAYVAMGVVFAIFCIMTPINAKYKLEKQIRTDVFVLTALAVAMEFALTNGFGWFTMEYVLPWIYVAAILAIDVLICTHRFKNMQLFSTLIFCTVFAIAPQIAMWITQSAKIYEPQTYICFCVFFAAILNIMIVFLVCGKSLKEEMERNLNV